MFVARNPMSYKFWVLDFDGTLYRQFPVRLFMLLWLLAYYFFHPWRLKELLILYSYRKSHEKVFLDSSEEFYQLQLERIARQYHVQPQMVLDLIELWMTKRPVGCIRMWQRKRVVRYIAAGQRRGIRMVIYSDNAVQGKLEALDFVPDYAFWSNDGIVRCMKPNPQGLERILSFLQIVRGEVLYIGDRDDKDRLCAERVGIDYLDVKVLEQYITEQNDKI